MRKKANPGKKSAAAKSAKSSPKAKGRQKTGRDILADQLVKLSKDMNEEGLKFLIQQAQVILHNMQVEKINEEMRKLDTMDRVSRKSPELDVGRVDIQEAANKNHFILIINRARKFLVLEEMRKLVKICHAAGNEKEASPRLYRWLSENRQDILVDAAVGGSNDPVLGAVYNLIIARYKVKE